MRRLLTAALSIATGSLGGCASALSVKSSVIDPHAVNGVSCVAVLPFENHTTDSSAGERVAQEVASALLTSEHFDVLQPDESEQVLKLLDVPHAVTASVEAARHVGEVLGVGALLTGSVTSYEPHDLTQRTPQSEPVVGFAARLVEVKTGNVLWSTTASNFDYPSGLAIPAGQQAILREAVDASTNGLVRAHDSLTSRGLCAKAYGRLERGEGGPSRVASISPMGTNVGSGGKSTTVPTATAGLSSQPAKTTQPAQPAGGGLGLPPLPGEGNGNGLPALPALPPEGGSGGTKGLPPMPPGTTQPGTTALPALPGLPASPPGTTALPALPGAPPGTTGLPALPDLPGAPAGTTPLAGLPSLEPVGEPAATPPGPAPVSLLGRLKGAQAKTLAKNLYTKKPPTLRIGLPLKASSKPSLVNKSKKSLDDLGNVLLANPTMRVRVEVHLDLKGRDATDGAMTTLSGRQAALIADYLKTKYRLGPERVSVVGMGRARPVSKKAGAAANSRVEVVVIKY